MDFQLEYAVLATISASIQHLSCAHNTSARPVTRSHMFSVQCSMAKMMKLNAKCAVVFLSRPKLTEVQF